MTSVKGLKWGATEKLLKALLREDNINQACEACEESIKVNSFASSTILSQPFSSFYHIKLNFFIRTHDFKLLGFSSHQKNHTCLIIKLRILLLEKYHRQASGFEPITKISVYCWDMTLLSLSFSFSLSLSLSLCLNNTLLQQQTISSPDNEHVMFISD